MKDQTPPLGALLTAQPLEGRGERASGDAGPTTGCLDGLRQQAQAALPPPPRNQAHRPVQRPQNYCQFSRFSLCAQCLTTFLLLCLTSSHRHVPKGIHKAQEERRIIEQSKVVIVIKQFSEFADTQVEQCPQTLQTRQRRECGNLPPPLEEWPLLLLLPLWCGVTLRLLLPRLWRNFVMLFFDRHPR